MYCFQTSLTITPSIEGSVTSKKACILNEIYEPVGCENCIGGYIGRIPIHEVLEINQDIRDAIVNNVRKDKLRELASKEQNESLALA